jgi:hypothetical protein
MPTTTRVLGFTNGVQRLVWSGPSGTITAHLWGGGGGLGGSDSFGGGSGTGGGYSRYQFVANDGDILDVAVGGPGANGQSGQGSAQGGAAGASYSLLLFNTRTTTASPAVYPTSNPNWSSFLNTYGVWEEYTGASNFSRTYTVNFPASDNYTFTFSVDNYGTVLLDGVPVISLSGSDPANYRGSYQRTINVTSGNHTISIQAVNTGGPGGVGLAISRTAGFSGGRGGNAGPAGSSGGGGGGGGATALFVNDVVVAAAGGGAGGGGGGRFSSGQTAPGTSGINAAYNGQNGQDHPGDGGGGGGGGGGWQSGNGGACGSGDGGGRAGSVGLSSAPGEAPTGTTPGGTSSAYYRSGIAQGASASQPATSGYAAIVIETTGTNINAGGTYIPVQTTYVKDSGVWKEAKAIWVKDNGIWKPVAGGIPPVFNSIPNTIGVNSRPYS